MPYCSQCGVEVDEDVERCPLCQTPIQKILPEEKKSPYPPEPAGSPPIPPLTMGEKMAIARIITTMGILIPLLFVTAIDYFITRRISWSSYVIVSLVGAWFIALISLFSWKKPQFLTGLVHLDILGILWVIGILSNSRNWFLPVALPIVACSTVLVTGAVHLIRRMKDKGANVAGVIILAVAFLCAAIDMVLENYVHNHFRFGWSLIVFSVMFPTALLLFYVQSPRFSNSRLRRFLHF
ncbi:MAG: hypothetical protein PQJ60_11485 [Spirochaetales bacterium]|nr:hypothetical protein [Spirochaetales bacterium]